MNKKSLQYGVVGLIAGIILTLIIAPLWRNERYSMKNSIGNSKIILDARFIERMDTRFIEQMIPHHDDAILMANIALQKSEHQEIKQLARNIIRTQTEEIEDMKKSCGAESA